MRRAGAFIATSAALAGLALASPASANVPRSWTTGDELTAVGPLEASPLRVVSLRLSFDLEPDLGGAAVTADYEVENPTDAPVTARLAAGHRHGERGPASQLTLASKAAKGAAGPLETMPPTERAQLLERFGTRPLMDLVVLPIAVAAHEKVNVTARYHYSGYEDEHGVNPRYDYEYLFDPARRWASFGPTDVTIQLPPDAELVYLFPHRREGDRVLVRLDQIPDHHFVFGAVSRKSTWLGMTSPTGYWVLVAAFTLLVTLGVAVPAGKLWATRTPIGRLLLRLFVLGPALALANVLAIAFFTGVVLPSRALGRGYGTLAFMFLVAILSPPVGAAIAALSARRRSLRAPWGP